MAYGIKVVISCMYRFADIISYIRNCSHKRFIIIIIIYLFISSILIQFDVPLKIISVHMRLANQKVGPKREYPEKTTWLVLYVPHVGLEPTPDTAVRRSNG